MEKNVFINKIKLNMAECWMWDMKLEVKCLILGYLSPYND